MSSYIDELHRLHRKPRREVVKPLELVYHRASGKPVVEEVVAIDGIPKIVELEPMRAMEKGQHLIHLAIEAMRRKGRYE